jgi:hypothetical protein
VYETTVHHYGYGPHLVDVVAIDFEQVAIQHDQVGSLARFDGAPQREDFTLDIAKSEE